MRVRDLPEKIIQKHKFNQVSDDVYELPAIWLRDEVIELIDQRMLPGKFVIYQAKDYKDVIFAIKEMVIRGAPAIGAMAAYGCAQASIQGQDLGKVTELFKGTRPTAFDLFYAVDHMKNKMELSKDPISAAEEYVKDIVDRCRKIGIYGNELISDGARILTHCNAGALATVDIGTALAPIRAAHSMSKNIFVYIDETRPRLQGARLTAWELYNEQIPHALIVDNAAGFYLNQHKIELVITGADRIACNGDAANKIGTYEKAVLARENGVPFYIAAPVSTFDLKIGTGSEIPIEERSADEVLRINESLITCDGVQALNPAFDVTPNKYITGYITEFGILKPSEISNRLPR